MDNEYVVNFTGFECHKNSDQGFLLSNRVITSRMIDQLTGPFS